MSARIDIITYNIRHGLTQSKVDEDLLKLSNLQGNHYKAFQEIHGTRRSDALEDFFTYSGFGVVRHVRIPGDYKTPIVYDKERKVLLDSGTEFLCPPMGEEGSGPATAVDKRATWARFEDLTSGNQEVVINCHLPPSPHIFQRGLLHKEAVDNLTTLAKNLRNKHEADVLICGDMNTDYYSTKGKSRFQPLMSAGFAANWTQFPKDIPTFPKHNSYIDWVIANIIPKSQGVMLGYNSDHRPLRVRY
jgi:exonuclease III